MSNITCYSYLWMAIYIQLSYYDYVHYQLGDNRETLTDKIRHCRNNWFKSVFMNYGLSTLAHLNLSRLLIGWGWDHWPWPYRLNFQL